MLLDKAFKRRNGFGIVEVLISAAVLGFLYLALMHLQLGNRETLLRIRGRDGAVNVAQQVLDSLQSVGAAFIKSKADADTTLDGLDYVRTWERCDNQDPPNCVTSSVKYSTKITVKPDDTYLSEHSTLIMSVKHVYAKNVVVNVYWPFKGTVQTISVSGVIR